MKRHFLLALLLLPMSAFAQQGRDFSVDVPAGDLDGLRLDANVGEVDIRAADIDQVEIRVRLEPDEDDWFGSSEALEKRLKEAELEHEVSDGELSVRLDYDRSRHGDDDLEETWEIRVPAKLAMDLELNVGSMEVIGTAGGVVAELNVGELTIEVEKGDVDAEVNVGELEIRSDTDSEGEFDLETNIGEASLRIDGERAGRSDGWLGNNVHHEADGEDDFTARVNVGEISVVVR